MTEDRTGMKQVELSDEERNERARRATAEQVELDALLAKKESHNREWNEQIKQSKERISVLSKEAEDGLAWVPAQTAMFDVATPSNDEASSDDDPTDDEPEEQVPARRRRRSRSGNHASSAA